MATLLTVARGKCTYVSEYAEGGVHDAGVHVLAGDLEGEPGSDRVQWVG